ncbi:MAG: hypothetical protein EBY55_07245 [Gammaproteobacteria bacterium]|nr:hypothetical protein [Gammaproteobacteria bacterium]
MREKQVEKGMKRGGNHRMNDRRSEH